MQVVEGSQRWYCRVHGCDELTAGNEPFGRCAMHALEFLGGAEQPEKGFPPIGTSTMPCQFGAFHSIQSTTEPLPMSDLALIEACDSRFGSLTLYGRGSVHLILEQLKSYVEEQDTKDDDGLTRVDRRG